MLGASLLMLAASGFFVARGGDLDDPDSVVSSESGHASALLNTDIPRATGGPTPGTSFVFVFESDSLQATDAAFQKALADAIAPLRTDPRVQSIRTYYDAPAQSAALLSRDGHATLVSVTLRTLSASPRATGRTCAAPFARTRSACWRLGRCRSTTSSPKH